MMTLDRDEVYKLLAHHCAIISHLNTHCAFL